MQEPNAYATLIVAVPTAVPAFIGYTPQVVCKGRSYANVPQKIFSFEEFEQIYCYPNSSVAADPVKQYSPAFYIVQQQNQPAKGDYLLIDGLHYSIAPDPSTIYYLYNSIRFFYANGGQEAYIVSVGTYGPPSKKAMHPADQIVNPNVRLEELLAGLALLKNEAEPTMYICPEATLLTAEDNGKLMQQMLVQCTNMGTAISIFDIIGGRDPDPVNYVNDISTFRNNTGSIGLRYGCAYYPFIGTTIMQSSEVDYTNLFGGDLNQIRLLLNPTDASNQNVANVISSIQNPIRSPLTRFQYNNALITSSPLFARAMQYILNHCNLLPPSGALAGVITTIDNSHGVWTAPANISVSNAATLPMHISDTQREKLNADISGKSINTIRLFSGVGILVWGAKTLDGNSLDWRFLSVRRTATCIEQSCKMALKAFRFQPNDKNTWEAVKTMISSFLNSFWQQGGLQGATAADAFSVNCGLGTTMTTNDLSQGLMIITILMAISRPAEFVEVTFQQQMAVPG